MLWESAFEVGWGISWEHLFSSSIFRFNIDNLAIQISWRYHRYCYSILPTCRSKYIRAGGVLTFISSWAKRQTKLWQSGHIFQNIIIQWNTSSRYTANTTRKKHARICAFESERKPIVYQSLVSSKRSLLLSKPTQAFKKLSRALRCLLRLLTTSVPKEDSLEYCSVVMMESYRVSQEEPWAYRTIKRGQSTTGKSPPDGQPCGIEREWETQPE